MAYAALQIQAELGEGHVNIIEAKEVLLTESHLALVMEYAAGNSLTGYVADKWQHAQHTGLFLSEDEARYFFRVSTRLKPAASQPVAECKVLSSEPEDANYCGSLCVGVLPLDLRGPCVPAAIRQRGGVLPCAQRRSQVRAVRYALHARQEPR